MQPSQDAWRGARVVVLNKLRRDERSELLEMESLYEEPPRITVDVQLHELKAFDFKWGDLHKCSASVVG